MRLIVNVTLYHEGGWSDNNMVRQFEGKEREREREEEKLGKMNRYSDERSKNYTNTQKKRPTKKKNTLKMKNRKTIKKKIVLKML